jgi:hypothetical protein
MILSYLVANAHLARKRSGQFRQSLLFLGWSSAGALFVAAFSVAARARSGRLAWRR